MILSIFTTLVGITNLTSELILVFIFNSILSGEVTSTKKTFKMSQYADKLIEDADSTSEDENLPFYASYKVF
jgi:hypothetical protein